VGYDIASLLWLDEAGEFTVRRIDLRGLEDLGGLGEDARGLPLGMKLFPTGAALPVVVPPSEFDPRQAYRAVLGLPEPHTCLGIVLAPHDEHLGYLVIDRAGPQPWAEDEVEALAAFAPHAATAIQNASLYTAQHEQAWISAALLQVAEALAGAEAIDEIAQIVARLTTILVGVERVAVLLADAEADATLISAFVLSAYHNASADGPPDVTESEADGSAARILSAEWPGLLEMQATHEPVITAQDEPLPPMLQPLFDGGITMLPLFAKGRMQGALVVGQAQGENPFTPHRLRLLGGIANHVALALENAQLAQSQQEEAWVSMALLQVAQAVAWQPTLEAGLETVARLIPILVGIDKAAIYRWDNAAGAFRLGQCAGWAETEAALLVEHLATADDLWRDAEGPSGLPSRLELPEALASAFGAPSCTVLPLRARGDLLGALVVESVESLGRRMSILNGIAHQLAMAMENARLAQEVVLQQRLEREVEMARSIQVSFLPPCCPVIAGLDLSAYWRSARQVGGDFYDFIPLRGRDDEERWGIAIADVADKGVPAALFMALSKTLLRAVAVSRASPGATLARVNELLLSDARTDLFVTVFYAIWEPRSGRLRYAIGGHNPPIWVGRKGSVQTLVGQGIALGVVDFAAYEDHELRLNPGDTLLLFTDGVTDALNREGEEFGMNRLMETAHRSATSPAQTAEDVIQTITSAVQAHVGPVDAFDDMTMVVLRRT
jgi:serine phosphatase RsbU (regulator of sigma subunit)